MHYVHNYVGAHELRLSSSDKLPVGSVSVRFTFEPTGKPDLKKGRGAPGRAQLSFNDRPAGETDFPVTVPLALGIGSGLSVGRNPGSAVSTMYEPPFPFTGTITSITYDLAESVSQEPDEERNATARARMARQ